MLNLILVVAYGLGVGAVALMLRSKHAPHDVPRTLAIAVLGALVGGIFGGRFGVRAQIAAALGGAVMFLLVWRRRNGRRDAHA